MSGPRSQNGWSANDRTQVSARTVRGTTVRLTVRNGPAGDLLLEVAALFDLLVQDLDAGVADDWGYAERPIRGSETISNHASGTAIDLNATRWPLGSNPSVNLAPAQIVKVRQIVAATADTVRWGGDYTSRKDPMHFEINDNRTEVDCARALRALRAHYGDPTSTTKAQEAPDMDQDQDARLRRVEAGLTTILQQLAGPGATLSNPWPGTDHGGGWEHWRYNNPTPARLSVVDLIRSIDRQVNSGLDLTNRPNPVGNLDDAFGQVLSARAEILDGLDELRALLTPAVKP